MTHLNKRHQVVNNLINLNPNWKSPAQQEAKGNTLSMAQYFNSNRDKITGEYYDYPGMGKVFAIYHWFEALAEIGREWVPVLVSDYECKKDEADRANFGYWHSSRAMVQLADGTARWIPFSMIKVVINNQ